VDAQVIEQERRRLSQRLDEVARLCESNAPPSTFYRVLLQRLQESLAAPACALWTRTAQGNLQLQFQINAGEVGLDKSESGRQSHDELLRLAVAQPKPMHLPPHSGLGPREEGGTAPGNPTDFLLLLVPIISNEQVAGLIEVWQGANRPPSAIPGFLQFMGLMADLAGRYQRNQLLGQMVGQQQLWTQLEAFARQIHGSLHTTEVAYAVANEGRRLVECDRISVAVRRGRRTDIEAVSGADTVEKRSNLVRLMRALCDSVLDWGEKLIFKGTKDDSLPPKVLDSLEAYLAESASQLLVVLPLRDEREGDAKSKDRKPPRSALLMECFEAPAEPQEVIGRLEVVGRHATSALYNAVEHRRIPGRWVWMPIAKLQEGLGGKTRAITMAVVVALALLGSALYFVPYQLKMDGTGSLVPVVRRYVYPPHPGTVLGFEVAPRATVSERTVLARMYDPDLEPKLGQWEAEMKAADIEATDLESRAKNESLPVERQRLQLQAALKGTERDLKARLLQITRNRIGGNGAQPGYFTLTAPPFMEQESRLLEERKWTVLSGNFREEWTGRQAKPSDPVLRVGAKEGPWELELKIPQKHIGQVLKAFGALDTDKPLEERELVVDFLLRSRPTEKFKGILRYSRMAGEANPNRDDKDESEPVVLAYVEIDHPDIPKEYRLSGEKILYLTGTEVHAKVLCGPHRLGYSLFYGVWEFFYEKVVFFF
jgi:hypothetical protein